MRTLPGVLFTALLVFLSPLATQAENPNIPPALQEWTGWVLHNESYRNCPWMAGSEGDSAENYLCKWPDSLNLSVNDAGARFTQTWTLYANAAVPLPGDEAHWPISVTANGSAVPVLKDPLSKLPIIWLSAGSYRLAGELMWVGQPESIPVADDIARIELTIDGKPVFPLQRDQSRLWLGRSDAIGKEIDSLNIQVFRLLHDVNPQRLLTTLRLRVSGKGREEVLRDVLPPNFVPIELSGDITARFETNGSLYVQVRPGTHEITLTARALEPIAELAAIEHASPWPEKEIWSYRSEPNLRITDVGGPPQIDPNLAEVPQNWRNFPAFEMDAGAVLAINQGSRGLSSQDQNRLDLSRELWLDFSGAGWTAIDRISGSLLRDWRLDMAPPYQLSRARENGAPLLITKGVQPGWTGVEVRERDLQLNATTRLNIGANELPITGWQHVFETVTTTLHLPPGYELIAAPGADKAAASWLDRWNLMDVFIAALVVFLCALAFGRVMALIPALYLLLAWHLPTAPRLSLLVAAGLALLAVSVTQEGKLQLWLGRFSKIASIFVVLFAVPFAASQIRQALYPQLEPVADYYAPGMVDAWLSLGGGTNRRMTMPPMDHYKDSEFANQMARPETPVTSEAWDESAASASSEVTTDAPSTPPLLEPIVEQDFGRMSGKKNPSSVIAQQADREQSKQRYASNTVVQAGTGEPAWQWRRYDIEIAGPVLPTQSVRLLMSPPWLTRLGRVVIVALLALTLLRLLRINFVSRVKVKVPAQMAATLLVSILSTGAMATNSPSQDLLDELGSRLRELPECAPECGQIARADIYATGEQIEARLELHAAERIALPLPGNEKLLGLESLTLDGIAANGVLRDSDGSMWLVVPRGVHQAQLQWRAARADNISLHFTQPAAFVTFSGSGWEASGINDGVLTTGSIELTRLMVSDDKDSSVGAAQNFSPYVIVTREIWLGLDWTVSTSVRRVSPANSAFSVAVPILEGERVMSAGLQIENGLIMAAFAEDQESVQWISRLETTDTMALSAPDQSGRSEVWRLNASPTWNVLSSGVPGVHTEASMHEFHPLPAETLTLKISRPQAVIGNTLAIDLATLHSRVGKRSSEHVLTFRLRATQGGQHALDLPASAEIVAVELNGQTMNLRAEKDRLRVPITPGQNLIKVVWRDKQGAGTRTQSPKLALNAAASNLSIGIDLPQNRWLILAAGPQIGPAVLYWGELLVMGVLAYLLARMGRTPLKLRDWLFLGIGFSTVSWWALAWFVGWLLALDWRCRIDPAAMRWRFNFLQLGLVLLTLVAGWSLFNAINTGLLGTPDLHVVGNGSNANSLHWFHDRTDSLIPIATAITLPMWLYRLVMLAWAFWLAWALIQWLRWGLRCFTAGTVWQPWFKKQTAPQILVAETMEAKVE